jgi:hypothetical protein
MNLRAEHFTAYLCRNWSASHCNQSVVATPEGMTDRRDFNGLRVVKSG